MSSQHLGRHHLPEVWLVVTLSITSGHVNCLEYTYTRKQFPDLSRSSRLSVDNIRNEPDCKYVTKFLTRFRMMMMVMLVLMMTMMLMVMMMI